MNKIEYGKTWWGKQWLGALNNIDFDNRLPRGRSYAKNGYVKDLNIKEGLIQAKVIGSRPSPYKVIIKVPPVKQDKLALLAEEISQNPVLIAHLLNHYLDPEFLKVSDKLDINIFPKNWDDLEMNCSCPDWAVPCKHLAAVVYMLSQAIDTDPFLVFSLCGIDLISLLKTKHLSIKNQVKPHIPSLHELSQQSKDHKLSYSREVLDKIDFSSIPQLEELLPSVLSANPVFYNAGDLRDTLQKVINYAAKSAKKVLENNAPEPRFNSLNEPIQIVLNEDNAARGFNGQDVCSIERLEQNLAELKLTQIADLNAQWLALFYIRLTALHLLSKGAVVPQVFANAQNAVFVRWIPAMLDHKVAELINSLAQGIPEKLLLTQNGNSFKNLAQCINLCSIFLNHYMQDLWLNAIPKNTDHKLLQLLFSGSGFHFDKTTEKAIPANLQTWLSRFYLNDREYILSICLEIDQGDDILLSLAVSKAQAMHKPSPMHAVLSQKKWEKERFSILQSLALLTEFLPFLNEYIQLGAKTPHTILAQDLPDILFKALPIIRLLGIQVLLPKELEKILRPKPALKAKNQLASLPGLFSQNTLFQFDWQIAIGKHLMSVDEFEKLIKKSTGIISFHGQYVYLEPEQIAQLQNQLSKTPTLTGFELLTSALASDSESSTFILDTKLRELIQELTHTQKIDPPTDITASLRPYQQRGYEWLYRNLSIGLGCIIADDMGLGKTLQVICALQKLKQEGELASAKVLVIVPTSLLTNWQKELARFAPKLSVEIFHGQKREIKTQERPDILITSYGIARRAQQTLQELSWRVMVIDEAQNIKNPSTAQTRAIKNLPAQSVIAMSGTPVENRLSDYWSIIDASNRGYLGSLAHFTKKYATPIQVHRDLNSAEEFKKITAPILIRRLKSDKSIISDLPDKIELDQFCTLTSTQAALYESVLRESLKVIHGESDTFKRSGLVLQMILALKQICNHPAQYIKQQNIDAELSGKAIRFLELIENVYDNHEKVLVFTQFREMGELLAQWIKERYKTQAQFLHGGVARAQRDLMVERFQTERSERVFILSLKAGGTGLNLTAASQVIHFDLWWNPAVEAQATDRAYRIGQKNNVQVHRLITTHTFEERINAMLKSKKELAELSVSKGERWIGQFNDDELRTLFAYEY